MSNQTTPFVEMLTGGHPNSLGRTVEVVEIVLADHARFDDLFQCYFADDEVVRLRTSSAMKRICREQPDLLLPYLDRFLNEIALIHQPSTQWTLAQLFLELDPHLTADQRARATAILQHNLTAFDDWIVIIQTLTTLTKWAHNDADLRAWLKPQLLRSMEDSRKSVAKNAAKLLAQIEKSAR